MRRILLALATSTLAIAAVPNVREGDLVFQTSRSAQSLAIQRATGSSFSHMGVVLFRGNKPFVFEAVATVRYTPLANWIARGEEGRCVVMRLRKPLEAGVITRLRREARRLEGRPYDLVFEWSDRRIYCSELVWKLYRRASGLELGTLQHLRDFDLTDPVVRAKLRERYGARVPLDEPVISPASMAASDLLETVAP